MRAISNKSLKIDNFAKGWMSDASLDAEGIYSLQTLTNGDIVYSGTKSKIRRRGGYTRHHATALPAVPRQVYEFVDTSGNVNLLIISNNLLYLVSGSNTEITNASEATPASLSYVDANFDYPFITVSDRCFFADDEDWYWLSHTSLQAGPYCYQVGIDKPDFDIASTRVVEATSNIGYDVGAGSLQLLERDVDTYRILAQSFQISNPMEVDAVTIDIEIKWVEDKAGRIQLSIREDSSGYAASTSLASSNLELADFSPYGVAGEVEFAWEITDRPSLSTSTTYWIVLDGDVAYNDNYSAVTQYVRWLYNGGNPYANGKAAYYDGSWNDFGTNDFAFVMGGLLDQAKTYYYRFAYYNDTHKSESQPTDADESAVVKTTAALETVSITNFPTINDDQVTHIRLYRTKGEDEDVTNPTFYYAGKVAVASSTYIDAVSDDNLGAELQSENHRRFSDDDDNLLVPKYLEQWQGRIFAVADTDNVLYFSKKLEGVGSLGVAGDYIYDYFPAENNFALDSQIRAVRKRGEDELVVYTSDNDIHVFRGGNSPLNPPPDLAHQPMFIGENCADSRSLVSIGAHHIYVTANNNIRAFSGGIDEQVTTEEIGTAIKTSMDAVGSVYSAAIYDNQYVLAVDADDDGTLDTLYITTNTSMARSGLLRQCFCPA